MVALTEAFEQTMQATGKTGNGLIFADFLRKERQESWLSPVSS